MEVSPKKNVTDAVTSKQVMPVVLLRYPGE